NFETLTYQRTPAHSLLCLFLYFLFFFKSSKQHYHIDEYREFFYSLRPGSFKEPKSQGCPAKDMQFVANLSSLSNIENFMNFYLNQVNDLKIIKKNFKSMEVSSFNANECAKYPNLVKNLQEHFLLHDLVN
ncbi:hypothetical protein BpHYR1_010909, partial [Brachionus plicatilis]